MSAVRDSTQNMAGFFLLSLSSCNIYLPFANQSHNYTEYQKINDLRIGDHASFFGRVVSFKPARKTSRGTI